MRHLSRLLIRLSYVFIAVVAALYWGSGRPPDCAPPKGVSRVDYADAPAALLAALRKEAGEVA